MRGRGRKGEGVHSTMICMFDQLTLCLSFATVWWSVGISTPMCHLQYGEQFFTIDTLAITYKARHERLVRLCRPLR